MPCGYPGRFLRPAGVPRIFPPGISLGVEGPIEDSRVPAASQ